MKRKSSWIWVAASFFFVALNMRIPITSVTPLLETIRHQLSISNATISLLVTVPTICMGLFALLTSWVGNRWGLERVIAICLLCIGLSTVIRVVTTTPLFLIATSLGIGIGVAVASPLLAGFIKKNFPNQIEGMIGVYAIGMGIGGAIGTGATIPMQRILDLTWMEALAFWSFPVFIALLLWLPVVKAATNTKIVPVRHHIPVKNKQAWLISVIFGLECFLHFAILTWLAPISLQFAVSELQMGMIVTVYMLVQTLFSFIIAILSRFFRNRSLWLIVSGLVVFVGLLPLSLMDSPLAPWIAAAILGVGTGGVLSISLLLPLDIASTPEEASSWTAMVQSVGFIFGAFGSVFVGMMRDLTGGFEQSLIGLTIVSLLLISVAFKTKRQSLPSIMNALS